MKNNLRIGTGYDVHPLAPGRKLVLGGVAIPFNKGLAGWSDGDALTHAVIDALLGAAALGDIGQHFPPGRRKYQDIPSLVLLEEVMEKLAVKGWWVVNIDATVIAEEPRLREYVDAIRRKLGQALGIGMGRVSIKASSNNGLGAIGRGEGIAAYAVALIEGGKDENI